MPASINRKDSIALRTGNIDKIEASKKFLNTEEARLELSSEVSNLKFISCLSPRPWMNIIAHFIFPTLTYNENMTNEEITQVKIMYQSSAEL